MDEPLINISDADRHLFPGSFTIRALRDSRYHNTAYAIAELIDNSIEAYADRIEMLCKEEHEKVTSRQRARLSEIAVLDNGEGMTSETLLNALKFGGGTRHNSTQGIGKYGMGLPTSSMSQCERVDVWTWQDGPNSVMHSYIDAEEISKGAHLVPIPDRETPIPEIWIRSESEDILSNSSGTLVLWSKLDKIQWKTGRALIDNTIDEVGRIHRHYINNDIVSIHAISFLKNQPQKITHDKKFVANDPLYLMRNTSTPEEPWNEEPMFKQWCDPKIYTTSVDGREATIEVQYSIVSQEALKTERVTQNPGDTPRGKHARRNIGVSVVREDREIILEDAFLREGGSAENPQNRWWGCQVLFFRDCDELFGVDHNKQMASNFTQAAKMLARDDRPNIEILEEMGMEEDIVHQIVGDIRDQTRAMMQQIRKMFAHKRNLPIGPQRRNPAKTATKTATDADRSAIEEGREQPTKTDKERERKSPDERISGLKKVYVNEGLTDSDAQLLAKELVDEELNYLFNPTQLDGYQMFSVRSIQGVLHINLNIDHPIYDLIKHIEGDLDKNAKENDPGFLGTVAIRLLLSSWARMEDQTESREERTRMQDINMRWGRQIDKVFAQLRERDD